MTVRDRGAGDAPLGVVGRLFGLRIVPPMMETGEEVRWAAWANMIQQRVRSVGGRVYLTDRRLVFGRTKIESRLGGKEWSGNLTDLARVSAGRRNIKVEFKDGRTERFIIGSSHEVAEVINEAIQVVRGVGHDRTPDSPDA